jgi:hypothetical protein
MKLSRWLVVTLLTLSALSVLGAAAWWWVTWPERTAREFIRSIASHDEATWKAMIGPNETSHLFWLVRTHTPQDWRSVEPASRSLTDVVMGRRMFQTHEWNFEVTRGVIAPTSDVEAKAMLLILDERLEVALERERSEKEAFLRRVEEARMALESALIDSEKLRSKTHPTTANPSQP